MLHMQTLLSRSMNLQGQCFLPYMMLLSCSWCSCASFELLQCERSDTSLQLSLGWITTTLRSPMRLMCIACVLL